MISPQKERHSGKEELGHYGNPISCTNQVLLVEVAEEVGRAGPRDWSLNTSDNSREKGQRDPLPLQALLAPPFSRSSSNQATPFLPVPSSASIPIPVGKTGLSSRPIIGSMTFVRFFFFFIFLQSAVIRAGAIVDWFRSNQKMKIRGFKNMF